MNISFYFNDFVHSMIAIESNLLLYLIKRKHILNMLNLVWFIHILVCLLNRNPLSFNTTCNGRLRWKYVWMREKSVPYTCTVTYLRWYVTLPL